MGDSQQKITTTSICNIEKAVRKLNGCVRQVEMLRPSGASEQDILTQAKALFMQDPNFKKGFKFDHVCSNKGF